MPMPAGARQTRADGSRHGHGPGIGDDGLEERSKAGRSLTFGPTRWEYSIRLRITRRDRADYEAEAVEFLTSDQIPEKGAVVPVRVHPQRPDVVVFDLPRA
jgi:hypothetical protein